MATAHSVTRNVTQHRQWTPDKRRAAVQAIQEACAATIRSGTEPHLTKPGKINQGAFAMVKPHLEIAGPSVEKGTPTFKAALKAYLETLDDPTGMRLMNLRLMAQTRQQNVTLINSLLAMIETRPNA